MSELHLFDVSQYIHSGVQHLTVGEGLTTIDGVMRAMEMPCAGITNLLNTYLEYQKLKDVSVLFCFDSPPTVKRELHESLFHGEGYKGKRKAKEAHIVVQLEMAYEIFLQIGIPCIKVDSYEADDLIASVVGEYQEAFDRIVIHSRDSDLFYLVTDNVEVAPVLRTGKRINRSNWEDTVITGYSVPYNLLTICKMRDGEQGDNIPAVHVEPMNKILRQLPERRYRECGDNEFLRDYIVDVVGKEDVRTIGIFDLIAPRILSGIELYEDESNDRLLTAYAIEMHCSKYRSYCRILDEGVSETLRRYIDKYIELSR